MKGLRSNKGRRGTESDKEIAVIVTTLSKLPASFVSMLTARQLMVGFGLTFSRNTVLRLKNVIAEFKEAGMKKGDRKDAREKKATPEEIGNQVALERIARIVTKSYAHLGDNEKIGTEEALTRVYAELKRFDPAIIERNEKRAIPR